MTNDCECGAASTEVVVTLNGSWLIECCSRCARAICDPFASAGAPE